MTQEIATIQRQEVSTLDTFAIGADGVLARKGMLNTVMKRVMQENEHYGIIPGTNGKPSLLKPGAEAIASTFRLGPRYQITRTDMDNGHREYEITCELYLPDGCFVGSGVGSATTMEGKYRFRKAEQKCPNCGKPAIIKGKQQYGGGWLCWSKKGGCNSKFPDGDQRIENQDMGRVEHDNPADYYNTVLKMGKKRAFVDAVLTATGASDIFTQDIEDMPEVIPGAARVNEERQMRQDDAPPPMDPMPESWLPPEQEPAEAVVEKDRPTQKQVGMLLSLAKKNFGMDEDAVKVWLTQAHKRQVTSFDHITKKEISAAIDAFKGDEQQGS